MAEKPFNPNNPTPAEILFMDIQANVRSELADQIDCLIEQIGLNHKAATEQAGLSPDEFPTPPLDFFRACAIQHLFSRVCNADPMTFHGGDRNIAKPVIENLQNIVGLWNDT